VYKITVNLAIGIEIYFRFIMQSFKISYKYIRMNNYIKDIT